jgi:Skp family chaperone for outer membrane proteins
MTNKIWVITTILTACVFFTAYKFNSGSPNIVYVDINKLYSEFKMTKELDNKLTAVTQARKNILDSLKFDLEVLSKQLANKPDAADLKQDFIRKREDYMAKSDQFTQDDQMQTQQYQEQILKQLNQYVTDYRSEKDYDVILGTSGNGVVMAADDNFDISPEVIRYINEKYKGTK